MISTYIVSLSQLHDVVADESGSSTTPDEVVGLLVQRGAFDLALSTASSLNVDMTPLFQSLARRCVELSRMSDIARYVPSTALYAVKKPPTDYQ